MKLSYKLKMHRDIGGMSANVFIADHERTAKKDFCETVERKVELS